MGSKAVTLLLVLLLPILVAGACESSGLAADDILSSQETGDVALTPVIGFIVGGSVPVKMTDGQVYLSYELMLTNTLGINVSLESLTLLDAVNPQTEILRLNPDDIAAKLRLPGATSPGHILGPAQSGVLLLDLVFADYGAVPGGLWHDLETSLAGEVGVPMPTTAVNRIAQFVIPNGEPVVIGPPLEGGPWIVAGVGPGAFHRATVMPVNGKWCDAQRWAVDYVSYYDNLQLAEGDPTDPASYACYGAQVIAVADGTVVHLADGRPDEVAGALPELDSIAAMDGNSIVLDIGGGLFAMYGHLVPGSIRVHAGETVTRGQVLGLVGNSGNSDAPHLHFHVSEGPIPLGANGQSYVIDCFNVLGQITVVEFDPAAALEPLPIVFTGGDPRINELPADFTVVEF